MELLHRSASPICLTDGPDDMTETENPITRVPLLDFTRVPESDKEAFRAAFDRVLASGVYILGSEVSAFEQECAAAFGVRHALGVSSGTDALLVALMALGVGPGDEVICPTYTFFATAGTIWRLGARPVFVDSHPCCFNAVPEAIEAAITPATKAILPVHLYGQCADMAAILALAARHDIPIVEDAAQAIGARCDLGSGRAGVAAAMGTIGCISFYPTKNLSGFGDAGLLTCNDDALVTRLDSLRVHGWGPKYHHKLVGGNFRMDAIQAALLRLRLPELGAVAARRRENAAFYRDALLAADLAQVMPSLCDRRSGAAGYADGTGQPEDRLGLPPICADDHTFNQFVIRVPRRIGRDRLRASLTERGVGTEIYYPLCMHQQECFASLGHAAGEFPVAEAAAETTLALPIFPGLTQAELHYVVDALVASCRAG
jgi:dTDP-4-amino-4,6-dideoxygalactose transaminase